MSTTRKHELERGGLSLPACAKRLHDEGLTDRVLSVERIRQIEQAAIKKIRKSLDAQGLSFEDLIAPSRDSDDRHYDRR